MMRAKHDEARGSAEAEGIGGVGERAPAALHRCFPPTPGRPPTNARESASLFFFVAVAVAVAVGAA
eukprot:1689506-Rhodomonas_salina.1